MSSVLFAVVVGAGIESLARAQEEDESWSADRPGFSDATWDVPWGHVVVETGVGVGGAFEALDESQVSLPDARIRVGLPGPLEAIVVAPSLVIDGGAAGDADTAGASDLGLGLKFASGLGRSASMSVVGTVTVPTATEGFGDDDDPTGRVGVNFDFGVTDSFTLTAAGYAGWAAGAVQLGVGGLAGYSFGALGIFGQAFVTRDGESSSVPDGDGDSIDVEISTWSLGIGGGVTYLPTDSIQLDVFIDIFPYADTGVGDEGRLAGLADPSNTPGLQAGVGFSFYL